MSLRNRHAQCLLSTLIGHSRPIADITLRRQFMPMRLIPLLPVVFELSACGAGGPLPRTPDARLVDAIETKLSKVPCIGPMSQWERHYSFSSRPSAVATLLTFGASDQWFDYDSVEIGYRQAGFEEFRPRRILYHGLEPLGIDDRNYNLVFGHYEVATGTAYIWACGSNLSNGADDPAKSKIVVH